MFNGYRQCRRPPSRGWRCYCPPAAKGGGVLGTEFRIVAEIMLLPMKKSNIPQEVGAKIAINMYELCFVPSPRPHFIRKIIFNYSKGFKISRNQKPSPKLYEKLLGIIPNSKILPDYAFLLKMLVRSSQHTRLMLQQ